MYVFLGMILMPIAILLSIWSYRASVTRILVESTTMALFGVYIVGMGLLAPHPWFEGTTHGSVIIVLSWILSQLLGMRIRCLIATRLERFGKQALFINGICTMLGQILAAVLGHFITGYLHDQGAESL